MREAVAIAVLAVVAALLIFAAYQTPVSGTVAIGGPLSPVFIGSSERLNASATEQGLFYADELDADGGRSRWTRQRALIALHGLGETGALEIVLQAQGWPEDTLGASEGQPTVQVSVNGVPVGSFRTSGSLKKYRLPIPAELSASDLRLQLETSSVFTATKTYPTDTRPHGVRLRSLAVVVAQPADFPRVPDGGVMLSAIGATVLGYATLRRARVRRSRAGALASLPAAMAALVIAVARPYAGPMLAALLSLLLLLFAITLLPELRFIIGALRRRLVRTGALPVGLLAGVVLGLGLLFARLATWLLSLASAGVQSRDPMLVALVILLGYGALLGLMNLSAFSGSIRRVQIRLISGRLSVVVLALLLTGWLVYQWSVIRSLPYVGHADYADNAVVARNLLHGRGWVVDYVTQFYRLNPAGSVVRPQETWPLLQPVWILPFFAAFGPEAWAAKLPNLIFSTLLAVAVFLVGARLWDRRAGLLAALLTLTNRYFFHNLTVFVTNDLGFVLLSFAAIALLFFGHQRENRRLLVWSGLLTGLMCLQKPSGVIVAGGLGLWWLLRLHSVGQLRSGAAWRRLLLGWALPAALIFSPYVARNLVTFGAPFYSTEAYDAWVLGFKGDSAEAWDEIYKIYTREGGLAGAGLPDRSWVLRWGFERTFQKIQDQFEATRDYLLPPFAGLPPLDGSASLVGVFTAWLAIIGILSGRGSRQGAARLLGLLLAAFGPYILFLCLYWHANEVRYFVPLVPWLALFAGAGLTSLTDALAGAWRGRMVGLSALLSMLLVVLAVQQYYPGQSKTGWQQIEADRTYDQAQWSADIVAFEWLREHTPSGSVVMTRVPWQLTYHAERPALMTPNTSNLTTLLRLAQYYRAEYLVVNAITNEKAGAREALSALIDGREAAGFKQLAGIPAPGDRTIYIYRFPPDYGGVAEIETP